MTQDDISKAELERQLESIRQEMDELAASSLAIPQRVKRAQVVELNSEVRKNELFAKYD